jgi:hypothetical protein
LLEARTLVAAPADVEWAGDVHRISAEGLLVRNNIVYTFVAVFAVVAQFAVVLTAFTLSVPAIANQPAGATATVSVTQEHNVRGIEDVIVEVRRPL